MRVEPAGAFQQLLVSSHLDDASIDHADDAMAAAHRRKTMRDDDDGSVPDDPAHVALYQTLAVIIQRGGRLVEYQDPRIGGERPRDCQPLALAARKIGAALLDHRVVALGQLVDELVGACQTRHLDDLRTRHRGLGEAMFSCTVRLKSRLSCRTTPMCRRSQAGSIWLRSAPSSKTWPS